MTKYSKVIKYEFQIYVMKTLNSDQEVGIEYNKNFKSNIKYEMYLIYQTAEQKVSVVARTQTVPRSETPE